MSFLFVLVETRARGRARGHSSGSFPEAPILRWQGLASSILCPNSEEVQHEIEKEH
jgi:hypothetical protein